MNRAPARPAPKSSPAAPSKPKRGPAKRKTSLFAHGEPMNWLTGGALVLALAMIVGLVGLVLVQGFPTFWPSPVPEIRTSGGAVLMGEETGAERYAPSADVLAAATPEARARAEAERAASKDGKVLRRLVRIGNYELTNEHFRWVDAFDVAAESRPEWALTVEREAWGRFYGVPKSFVVDGKPTASDPAAAFAAFEAKHDEVRARVEERRDLERHAVGDVNHDLRAGALKVRKIELERGKASPEAAAARAAYDVEKARLDAEGAKLREKIAALDAENARYRLVMATSDGREQELALGDVVRAYPANRLSFLERVGVYLSRWKEFVLDEPREANSEGGVFPAIFGTVVMTLLMSLAVVPFGVLAALYLREYAKQGPLVAAVRIAVNNLAGVPSIVFGVFGLGFFCYGIGARIDELFFAESLPSPTFGTGGVLWASATLALLTLPVVVVSAEEALAAVPRSMREGSYACGASKWQTIRRIVLPRAAPGIMTGMILAMARGAGEVAPLMLVGAVKLAPDLPVDGRAPFIHPERSFMHLGFHIYDLGFQSPNSEAAKPMVYTTTFLLILVIVALNVAAIRIRSRLRKKFVGGAF
jgi:phosphate transport system permease protein